MFLRRARASLVVIIEPGFSDCDHFGMARSADQLVDADVELFMRVMGMRAERAVDVGKALGDAEHLGMSFDSRRDGHDARNAGCLRAGNHGVELVGKIGEIEMAVAVDQHGS